MKKAMMLTLLALFNLGAAQADALKPNPGFDRVGMVADKRIVSQPTRFAAPGEGRRADETVLPERKREMARRLVWLMLSAR